MKTTDQVTGRAASKRRAARTLSGVALVAVATAATGKAAMADEATAKPAMAKPAMAEARATDAVYVSRSQVVMTSRGVMVHNPALARLATRDRKAAVALVRTKFPEVRAESLSVDRSGGVLIRGVKVGRATAAESKWVGFICGNECRPVK